MNLAIRTSRPLLLGLLVISSLILACQSDSDEDAQILVSPQKGPFSVVVTTTGELQAKKSVRIYGPRSAGRFNIYQIKINSMEPEGTRLSKGDKVAELDRSELMGKISEQENALQKAQSQYTQVVLDTALDLSDNRDKIANLRFEMEQKLTEKEQSIYEAPSIQRQVQLQYDQAKRALDQALSNYQKRIAQSVAKVKEVEADLNQTKQRYRELQELMQEFTILAPEDGMLTYYREWRGKRKAGSTISSWNPVVATLPDLSEMISVTFVNEIDIQKIQEGMEVEIGLDAMADKQLKGTVTSVANIGEQRPGTDSKVFEVSIEVLQSDTTLRPSMTTSNEILVADRNEAMYIPLECLFAQDSISFVYAKDNSGLQKREVSVGLLNENDAEILAGLKMEDQVYLSLPADTSGIPFISLGQSDTHAPQAQL
ncbi:MAG: HlyD family efflux transporter periplasmic adaptor subunit [Bacteroidota bacterium]